MVVFDQSGFDGAKVIVFRQKLFYLGKSGCIGAELVVFVRSGCIWTKVVVFRQKWLYSKKSG